MSQSHYPSNKYKDKFSAVQTLEIIEVFRHFLRGNLIEVRDIFGDEWRIWDGEEFPSLIKFEIRKALTEK